MMVLFLYKLTRGFSKKFLMTVMTAILESPVGAVLKYIYLYVEL